MGWFERKLMVLSAVVGLRIMSISRLGCFRIMSRSRKLIHPLFSYMALRFMSVCIWFIYVLMRSVWVLFGVMYNYNIVYITYVEYCFLVKEFGLYVHL